ncbi:S8 family peptidase [Olivibacter sp. SDN3]|uniref:S8 family peptidase n=1 Tax=Olivibacter sp. SDN3 TaxID=2764720 RepID=UPI001651AB91|nr:S8 family peptidase [Olivibacter sp. SDN3]QNL51953.1 S8 family peptidase [Olivibacter sp. SDN3]
MNQQLPHLYLKNPSGHAYKFDKSRGMEKNDTIDKDPAAYRPHKQRLSTSFNQLLLDKANRLRDKRLVPEHIEIIEIRFLIPFSDGLSYKTRTRFLNEFGLSPVIQKDFNRTVLFAIVDEQRFRHFDALLHHYIESSDRISPKGKTYAIMTTLFDVKYHTASDIRNQRSGDLVFELINTTPQIDEVYETQHRALKNYLEALALVGDIDDFSFDPYGKMLQLKGANRNIVDEMARNFDILAQAHTLRSLIVKPDQFNITKVTWDFTIRNRDDNHTVIGVIDNGIRPIEPLREIVMAGIDITRTNDPLWAAHRHGTVVASLAAVGDRFFTGEEELDADAKIYSIKILESIDGYIDVIKVVEAIQEAHIRDGVRLFNLSICAQSKSYNESPSFFSYLLDKLAYELDILIFIAAGNMNYDDLVAMQENPHDLHNYPNHFYNPNIESDIHSCIYTNICIPAESMNHVTIGALADNYRPDTAVDLSLDKNLPAYYSRKNHYDFKQKINGAVLSSNHGNKNFFKPDIVMPGGDLLQNDAAMQVPGFGDGGNDYYTFDSGTSLSAPLAANLAAQVLNIYPDLSLQSIKALLINSTDTYPTSYLEEMVIERKNSLAIEAYGVPFDKLSATNKTKITRQVLSEETIHRNLVGHGKPNKERLLYSTANKVSLIVEETIRTDHHKVILLHVPEYLLEGKGNKRLAIQATLCYKFNPAWGNHVDYNPLHISFNFANSVVKHSLDNLADILADRNHEYYKDNHWTDEIRNLEDLKAQRDISDEDNKRLLNLKMKVKNKALGIKNSLGPWSEDFFPLVNKPLSNRQQLSIQISKSEIGKIGNQIAIVMRCAVKDNLDLDLQEWARITKEHPFSLALSIEDKSKIDGVRLYDEIQAVNILEAVPNNITQLDQDLDIEL